MILYIFYLRQVSQLPSSPEKRRSTRCSSLSRNPGIFTESITSTMNACISILRASASGIPLELTGSGTVATLHLIVVDDQLRFAVHAGMLAGQYIAVALVSLGVRRIGGHSDAPLECSARLLFEHIFEKLVAVAMRRLVKQGVIIVDVNLTAFLLCRM